MEGSSKFILLVPMMLLACRDSLLVANDRAKGRKSADIPREFIATTNLCSNCTKHIDSLYITRGLHGMQPTQAPSVAGIAAGAACGVGAAGGIYNRVSVAFAEDTSRRR